MVARYAISILLALSLVTGCSSGYSGYSALSSGSKAPAIEAVGWTNGNAPEELEGNVVVLEMFATW